MEVGSGIPGTPGADEYVRPPGYWEEGPGTVAAVDWEQKFSGRFFLRCSVRKSSEILIL